MNLMNRGKEKILGREEGGLKNCEIEDSEIKLVRQLGSGCFGTVYLGECRESTVAVKVPHVQELSQEELQDLRREVQIMATNPHPNIMLFLGACTIPGKFKIVMEKLDGDLEHLLLEGEGKKMSLFQRLLMAKDAAEGMNWLHLSEPAIIHRDLKLENLMYKKVGNNYSIRVADFGLACIKPKAQKSLRDTAKGTPLTRAPEIMEDKPFNQKADVYSFAMCLWEIYTCKDLFPHHSDYDEFMEAICVKGERPPIPKNCLPSLKALLEDCWQKDPNRRPDFTEINQRLNNILVEAAVNDPDAQAFWKEKFLSAKKLQRVIKFNDFCNALYRYLGLGKPPKDDGSETKDPFILNLRALKALAGLPEPGNENTLTVEIEAFGRLVQWFGPFKNAKGQETILDRMRLTCGLPGFYGNLETKEAQSRLEGKPVGYYLIRFSLSEPLGYAITRVGQGDQIKNVKILIKNHEFCVTEKGKTYPSLEALITELKDTLELRTGLGGSKFEKLGLEEAAGPVYEVVVDDEDGEKEN